MTLCECGCEQEIIQKSKYHILKYILGHNRRGKHPTEKTLKKMAQIKIGKNHPMFGKPRSEETKQKISKSHIGLKHTEETKNKLRIINLGKKHSEENKQKMSNNQPKKYKENNPNWKGGTSFEPYCEKFNERKKEEVRNQYNRKCYICGKLESDQIKEQKERGKRGFRLSVHHIDNDKEQGCNGKSWKLVPLCSSCHNKLKGGYKNEISLP